MKNRIHPNWYHDAKVTCTCGNTFTTGSTQQEIEVDICSQCHPFFTGEMKFVDRQGRVDRFKQKMDQAKEKQEEARKKQKHKDQEETPEESLSYQEILRQKKSQLRQEQSSSSGN